MEPATGVSEFDGSKWINYTTSDGLVNNWVNAIAIDANGNKWFGTIGGVSRFDGINWTNYTTTNGLAENYVITISIDAVGNIWFGTTGGVSKLEDEPTGITDPMVNNKSGDGLTIYPNPSINETIILFPCPGIYTLTIINMSGKIIKQFLNIPDEKIIIKTKDLDAGVYLLSLKNITNGNIYKGKMATIK